MLEGLNIGGHISNQFEQDLENIRTQVLAMGGLVEQQVQNSVKALIEADQKLGEDVANSDYKVNALEVEIDEMCNRVIALRQPAASDLRFVITMIKTITDLERIGDEAEKIGRFSLDLIGFSRSDDFFSSLRHLGDHVSQMLNKALDAFARMDVSAALDVAADDANVNKEFEALMRQLMTHMIEDPRSIREVLQVMWCARALERVGDHASNVCEYVIFMVEGKDVRHTSLEQIQEEIS